MSDERLQAFHPLNRNESDCFDLKGGCQEGRLLKKSQKEFVRLICILQKFNKVMGGSK